MASSASTSTLPRTRPLRRRQRNDSGSIKLPAPKRTRLSPTGSVLAAPASTLASGPAAPAASDDGDDAAAVLDDSSSTGAMGPRARRSAVRAPVLAATAAGALSDAHLSSDGDLANITRDMTLRERRSVRVKQPSMAVAVLVSRR